MDTEKLVLNVLSGSAALYKEAQVEVLGGRGPRRIRLSCSVPGTASLTVIPDDCQVDVFIGEGTRIELFPKRMGKDRNLAKELRDLVEAVVYGRFEEELFKAWGRVLRSRGAIHTPGGGRKVVSSGGPLLGFFWPARKELVSYEAYR